MAVKRGRESLASQLIAPDVTSIQRPPPPYSLTDAESDEWTELVPLV